MRRRVLDLIVCPVCGGELGLGGEGLAGDEIEWGTLRCAAGHMFAVAGAVPRLVSPLGDSFREDARSISDSFGREWRVFSYERVDRTWGQDTGDRCQDFLRYLRLRPEDLEGKVVLDAGCGNGLLGVELAERYRCEVLATDISSSVLRAYDQLLPSWGAGRVHLVQADIVSPPFRPQAFDIVICAGVLHHTRDTKEAFDRLAPALAPGGTIFVWLYHHVPGPKMAVRMFFRKCLAPLPGGVKEFIVATCILPQSLARQHLRTLLRRNDQRDRLRTRERLVMLLDSYTCRYRWEHTPEEVHAWFRERGYAEVETTEVGRFGFGVRGREPGRDERVATLCPEESPSLSLTASASKHTGPE